MTTDLIPKQINPAKLFSENGLEPVLAEIKNKADAFIETASLETDKTRKEIASFAYKVAQSKTFLDGLGKKLVEDRKAEIKLVDNERKRMRDALDAEKERVRKPLDEWEAEEKRKEDLRRKQIEFEMDWDEALKEDDIFNREREIKRKEAEFARIEEERRQNEEAERLEKERFAREEQIRKEAAERAAKEAQEKIEAEKRRAIEAEQKAKEAAEKAERDRIASEERAKIEAERAEHARIEALKKAEDEKQAANKKHQAKINNEVLAALMKTCGLPEIGAKAIIETVAKNLIPHMRIEY